MNIAIVDDEKKWQEKLERLALENKSMVIDEIDKFDSGEAFVESKKDFPVVFMDIEMQGMDGFDTIQEYRKSHPETKFIITTTHTEVSRKGFLVEAYRYLDKLCVEEEITEAFASLANVFRQEKNVEIQLEDYGKRKFKIKDIIYFETYNRKLLMHTIDDDYVCHDNITDLEQKLSGDGFVLTHRSYLVNLKYIKSVETSKVLLENGDEVFLSRGKRSELKMKYMEYRFGGANR